MDVQNITKKIQECIADGDTESAVEALVEYMESAGGEQYDNAILLSGQYRKWKRGEMLGLEQPNSELRRIEMSILAILKAATQQEPASSLQSAVAHVQSSGADYAKWPISPGTNLTVGEKYFSPDKRHFLRFEEDGNLCIRRSENEAFTWGSYQAGAPLGGKAAIMQTDGNLVIHDANDRWIWGTQTTDPSGFLGVTPQGGLVVIGGSGEIIWAGIQMRR